MNNIRPMDSSIFLSEIGPPQGDTNPTVNNSSAIEMDTYCIRYIYITPREKLCKLPKNVAGYQTVVS